MECLEYLPKKIEVFAENIKTIGIEKILFMHYNSPETLAQNSTEMALKLDFFR